MHEPVDKVWFAKLKAIHAFSLVGKFSVDPGRQKTEKAKFLDSDNSNPTLTYHRLERFKVDRKRTKLVNLLLEITETEKNEAIKTAYTLVIRERIDHLDIIKATQNGDDELFGELMIKEFGLPTMDALSMMMPHVLDMLAQAKLSTNELCVEAAHSIFEQVKDIPASEDHISCEFSPEPDSKIRAKAICARFNAELKELSIAEWKAVVDYEARNSSIHIDQNKKRIVVPSTRSVSEERLSALVSHEVGVHVVRRVNAEKSNLLLLSAGLDHYLRGDEGLAKLEEVRTYPSALNSTIEVYLGLSLAMGIVGEKLDFREVYNFYRNYFLASRCSKGNLSLRAAQTYGWNRAISLFQGTTGKTAGICFTRGLAYMHGYLDLLEVLKTHPEEKNRLFRGKYDPSNPVHREILDKLLV